MTWNLFSIGFLVVFGLRRGFELLLDGLQYRHLLLRKDKVPKHLEGKVDLQTIRKAVSYNTDKLRFSMISDVVDMAMIWLMVLWGFAMAEKLVAALNWAPLTSGLAFFGILTAANGLVSLPFELYSTFVIEEKHGFNRQTPGRFFQDKLKGLVIGAITGALLLSLVLLLMESGGPLWWLYAFVGVSLVQLLLVWIYPVIIMPWFNRFTPVQTDLAAEVSSLAGSVQFPLKSVYAMDGSKRSAHANAFIIGLWGARKIVLFDTLIEKVTRAQLMAVLAHELGHFKLKHLSKRIVTVLISLAGMFYGISVLKNLPDIYAAFGFATAGNAAVIVIFSLILTEIAAPFAWLLRYRSRKDEYAADRFAVAAVRNGEDLSEALIALNKQNLTSPGSHKLYRNYYNSHPSLKDRLAAISAHAEALGFNRTN